MASTFIPKTKSEASKSNLRNTLETLAISLVAGGIAFGGMYHIHKTGNPDSGDKQIYQEQKQNCLEGPYRHAIEDSIMGSKEFIDFYQNHQDSAYKLKDLKGGKK